MLRLVAGVLAVSVLVTILLIDFTSRVQEQLEPQDRMNLIVDAGLPKTLRNQVASEPLTAIKDDTSDWL